MSGDFTIRMPPHSVESEQAVLGALLLDVSAYDRIASVLTEQDFYGNDHRAIFRAMTGLIAGNSALDAVTLAEAMERAGELERCGGLKYLVALANNTPSAANAGQYAEIVRERSLMRRLACAVREVEERIHARGQLSARELIDYAQERMLSVSERAAQQRGGPSHVAPVLDSVLKRMDELGHRSSHSDVTGLATGFDELDRLTTGMQAGELIIVAARPSMGKTALSLNIAEHVALVQKKRVLFFSLEMANDQLGMRMLSSVSKINQQRVRVGRLNEHEWRTVYNASVALRECGIWLDEEGSLTANELRARARTVHRESGGIDLIIIDYLQLMNTESSGRSETRAQDLGQITRALKHLAKELACPVVLLSQLNRGLEQRPNKRPIMSDLRDSGAIEQDADWIVFVYRDEVYNPDSPDAGIAELIIGKQRNGPTGTVHVDFRGEFTRFENRPKGLPIPSHEARALSRSARASRAPTLTRRRPDARDGPEF